MPATSPPAPPAARPGGRSARVRAAVHRATEELLAEGGPEAATIPAVAARAGVHATTVYRRWGTAAELRSAVAIGRLTGDVVVPDTGSLRGDLEQWARDVRTDVADPDVLLLIRTVIGAAAEAGVRGACLADRHAQLDAILEKDASRGGPPRDGATLVDTILGPIYFRALFADEPLPAARIAALVDQALAG